MRYAATWLGLLAAATAAAAQYGRQPGAEALPGLPVALQGVGLDQRLNEQVPLDIPFRDEAGQAVKLGDAFDARPVILVMAYYRCPMLCTQVLNGLVDALRKVPFRLGDDYRVVTVSFDARETPELAAAKKGHYLAHLGKPEAGAGWRFLTGDQSSIDRLCAATGFRYRYNADTDQFAHASGILILTPQGKIARYFYGISYSPRDVRLGLVEAAQERIGSPVDQIMLFCFHYDAAAGRYTAAARNLVKAGGVATVLGLGLFIALARRRRPAAATEAP